jgi:hypothetical protein
LVDSQKLLGCSAFVEQSKTLAGRTRNMRLKER